MIDNTLYKIEKSLVDYLTYNPPTKLVGLKYTLEGGNEILPVTVEVRQGSIEYDKASYPSLIISDSNLDIETDDSAFKEPRVLLPELSNADYESGTLDTIVYKPIATSRGVYMTYNFEIITKSNSQVKDILMQFINLLPVKKETVFNIEFAGGIKRNVYLIYDGASMQHDEFKGSLRIFRKILRYRVSIPLISSSVAEIKEYALSLSGKVRVYQVPPKEDNSLDIASKSLDYTINQ